MDIASSELAYSGTLLNTKEFATTFEPYSPILHLEYLN